MLDEKVRTLFPPPPEKLTAAPVPSVYAGPLGPMVPPITKDEMPVEDETRRIASGYAPQGPGLPPDSIDLKIGEKD